MLLKNTQKAKEYGALVSGFVDTFPALVLSQLDRNCDFLKFETAGVL